MRPPINPSMVLLGLSLGRNEFFPRFLPMIYAPVSKTATLKITASSVFSIFSFADLSFM